MKKRILHGTLPKASWPYVLSHPVLVTVGVVAVLTGFLIGLWPDLMELSSLGIWIPGIWERLWPSFHAIGGLALLYGILHRKPHYEAAGCVLLASTFASQCVAVLAIRGFGAGFLAAATLGSLALGLAIRCYVLAWAASRGRET